MLPECTPGVGHRRMHATGSVHDYQDHHPTAQDCVSVVEVSDTTVSFDRSKKARLYSSAGVLEYWVVDLKARSVVVHRDATPDAGYRSVVEIDESGFVEPAGRIAQKLAVSAFLPLV